MSDTIEFLEEKRVKRKQTKQRTKQKTHKQTKQTNKHKTNTVSLLLTVLVPLMGHLTDNKVT